MEPKMILLYLLFLYAVANCIMALVGFAIGFRPWFNWTLFNNGVTSIFALLFGIMDLPYASIACFSFSLGVFLQRVLHNWNH